MKTKLYIIAIAVMAFFFSTSSKAQTAAFYQLNFIYNTDFTPHSDWGAADITFIGTPALLYLNLTVDTSWVIENIPVQSIRGIGLSQTQRFWFPIGPDGIPVSSLTYGFTLTPGVSTKPVASIPTSVLQDTVEVYSGGSGNPPGPPNKPKPSEKQKGNPPVQPPQKNEDFPNQEAGTNECVPVGISNSLNYLNAKHGLGMAAPLIGIQNLKIGLGWNPAGCPRPGWVKNKEAYVKANKLPITTRKINGRSGIKNIGAEINAKQDVELDVLLTGNASHCVCVTGWTDLGGGKYKLTITHDSKQGKAGGTVDESAIYDSNTKTWSGALAAGSKEFFFVVECPAKKNNQPNKNLPGGTKLKSKANTGNSFSGGGVVVQNFEISGYPSSPAPSLGSTSGFGFSSMVTLELSMDSGVTFTPYSAMATVGGTITHTADAGGKEYYDTEIVSMSLSGGTLPPLVLFRESPSSVSSGIAIIEPITGGFEVINFFDVALEISLDGGALYLPEDDDSTTMLEADSSASIPTMPQWGLIIFTLLLVTIGVRFATKRQYSLSLTSSDQVITKPQIDKVLYLKILGVCLLIASVFILFANWYFHGLSTIDTVGILISAVIVSDMIYFWLFKRYN